MESFPVQLLSQRAALQLESTNKVESPFFYESKPVLNEIVCSVVVGFASPAPPPPPRGRSKVVLESEQKDTVVEVEVFCIKLL